MPTRLNSHGSFGCQIGDNNGIRSPTFQPHLRASSSPFGESIARLARAETLTLRNADYIAAVRIQGASSLRIILRHIVPMCLPSVVIRITLNMAGIIITAAGLGFLGLGAQPPMPEWGAMLSEARIYLGPAPNLMLFPGAAIFLSVLGFNLLGDGLRDVLDPRTRRVGSP